MIFFFSLSITQYMLYFFPFSFPTIPPVVGTTQLFHRFVERSERTLEEKKSVIHYRKLKKTKRTKHKEPSRTRIEFMYSPRFFFNYSTFVSRE
jgi:hypothetical protein